MTRYRWLDDVRSGIIITNEETGDERVVQIGTEEYNSINVEMVEPSDEPEDDDDQA